mmetsp:Transcript_25594/g.57413  ORF Transcript_25594/g.57413 Transcript_25594/m.57413 type:complete len:275 (-) Transcript_25594:549-1373(-)
MHAAAEAEVLEGPLVLLPPAGLLLDEAVRVELLRARPHRVEAPGDGGGGEDDVALGDDPLLAPIRGRLVRLDHHVHLGLAHEHDERWVHAKGLLDTVVHQVHLRNHLVRQVSALGHDGLDLFPRAVPERLVVREEEGSPGRGDGARVLAGEEEGDEEADNLVVRVPLAVHVGVARLLVHHVDEHLQNIRVLLGLLRVRPPCFDDVAKELDHLDAGGVALLVVGGGKVREEEGERRDALVQVVVQVAHLGEEIFAYVVTVKAPARRQNRQVRKRL